MRKHFKKELVTSKEALERHTNIAIENMLMVVLESEVIVMGLERISS